MAKPAKKRPAIEFHKGIDYACLMLPHQTTDAPIARLYGTDREVTKYGQMFAASEDMLELLKELIDIEGPQPGTATWAEKVRRLIATAEGRTGGAIAHG